MPARSCLQFIHVVCSPKHTHGHGFRKLPATSLSKVKQVRHLANKEMFAHAQSKTLCVLCVLALDSSRDKVHFTFLYSLVGKISMLTYNRYIAMPYTMDNMIMLTVGSCINYSKKPSTSAGTYCMVRN